MAGQSNDLFGKINLGTGFLIYLQRFFIMHGNANIPEQFSGRAINLCSSSSLSIRVVGIMALLLFSFFTYMKLHFKSWRWFYPGSLCIL